VFPVWGSPVTQQYIIGQFSLLLADLQPARGERLAAVDALRRAVESAPLSTLPQLAHEAIDVIDAACWVALERGEVSQFRHYAQAARALREFADSAGILP
jgi:hypothetical protein